MAISRAAAQPEAIGTLTENGNRIGQFTIGGTLALVVFIGVLGGAAASLVVVASEPLVRRVGLLGGPIIGAVVLATVGVTTFESIDFRLLEPRALNVAMFLGLFLLFGVTVIAAVRLLDRWLPAASEGMLPLYLTVVALGALPLLLNILNFTSRSFCGCDPWTVMGLLVLLTTLAAIGWQVLSMRDAPSWQRLTMELAATTGLIAILVLGLGRVIEDIGSIL